MKLKTLEYNAKIKVLEDKHQVEKNTQSQVEQLKLFLVYLLKLKNNW
jgi:hypothetical protein